MSNCQRCEEFPVFVSFLTPGFVFTRVLGVIYPGIGFLGKPVPTPGSSGARSQGRDRIREGRSYFVTPSSSVQHP